MTIKWEATNDPYITRTRVFGGWLYKHQGPNHLYIMGEVEIDESQPASITFVPENIKLKTEE